MSDKKSYFQGGGGENEPTSGKSKYKKEPINPKDTMSRGLFFNNYDLYDVSGPTPGTGLYQHMKDYESIADFRKKKRKNKMRNRRKGILQAIWIADIIINSSRNYDLGKGLYENMGKFKSIEEFRNNLDINNLADPDDDEKFKEPIIWNSAVPGGSPIGLLDGIYPEEDLKDTPIGNLYYGIDEMHRIDT